MVVGLWRQIAETRQDLTETSRLNWKLGPSAAGTTETTTPDQTTHQPGAAAKRDVKSHVLRKFKYDYD